MFKQYDLEYNSQFQSSFGKRLDESFYKDFEKLSENSKIRLESLINSYSNLFNIMDLIIFISLIAILITSEINNMTFIATIFFGLFAFTFLSLIKSKVKISILKNIIEFKNRLLKKEKKKK